MSGALIREGDFPVLHKYCQDCRKCRVATKDGPRNELTGKPHYKSGEFIVPCHGIPKDLNYIPNFENIKHGLDDDEIEFSKSMYDPVLWAKLYLDWEPRTSPDGQEFQALPLRCTSKRKVFRYGRRLGKTEMLCVSILHYLFTNSPTVKRWDKKLKKEVAGFSTILVLAPYLSQIKLIFDRLGKFIDANPLLGNEVKRNIASPFHTIELYNGSKVVGFPSGAKSGSGAESVRGQKADFIVLDEMDYLREQDLENILAMLMEHSDVTLYASSTPTGKREHFWRFCIERMDFKEFYAPSMVNPSWSPEMELELRTFYQTDTAWQHEIMAEFGESATGVFQTAFVDAAQDGYKYETQKKEKGWVYGIGVDWNDVENGTKLVVIGLDPSSQKFRVVEKVSVQRAGWTQTSSIAKLIELNRKWAPEFITVDEGYGATQIEILKKLGMEAELKGQTVDAKLKKIKAINLSSKIELYDPLTQLPTKEWIKPFMVNNAVRRFEQGQMEISRYDDDLQAQLLGYSISKVTVTGMPVYAAGPAGDHDLDGMMLSLLGFTLGMSEFTNLAYSGEVAISGKFGDRDMSTEISLAAIENRDPEFERTKKTRVSKPSAPEQRSEPSVPILSSIPAVISSNLIGGRIYSHEAFNSDNGQQRTIVRKVFRGPPARSKF